MELDPRLGGEVPDTPSSVNTPQLHQQHHPYHYPEEQHESPGQDLDPKRSRACEACRGLKVRCEPDPLQGPCKRCKKAGRQCVVTAPSRKRQKKTDSRVSELEKKIDALTASLHARSAGSTALPTLLPDGTVAPDEYNPDHVPNGPSGDDGRAWGGDSMRHRGAGGWDRTNATSAPPATHHAGGHKRKADDEDDDRRHSPPAGASPWVRPSDGDIVDRGIITMDLAATLFERYRDRMAPHLPAVVFPPSTTVPELRRTKPTLFLSIMASAGSEMPHLTRILQKELMQTFAEKVFLTGEKSLEIVQAVLVATIWHWPPERFEELKFYQLIHVAAVMAIDIGLGKKNGQKRSTNAASLYTWQNIKRQPLPDPTSIESRRTWLACFFLTSTASMALHRPNLVRWTSFMTECVDLLESSPDAAPTDKYFCHCVWTHRLGEDISGQFSMDDPSKSVDINDPRSQHVLKALERDLEKYRASVPPDLLQHTLRIGFNMVSLYMHEVALHNKTAANQLRPPYYTETFKEAVVPNSEPLSATHVNSISACLTAVDDIFTTFLSLDITSIRCLPTYNLVRVAYGIVILVKMHFSASSPNSELGKVINKDNLRVEYYLDALVDKFRMTAANEKSRPASKFLIVLAMLRSWFIKQGKQDAQDAATSSQQQQQQQQTANTPLQLLSEVATGSDSTNPRASSYSSMHQTPQPYYHDTGMSSATSASELPKPSSLPPLSDNTPWIMPLDPNLTSASGGFDFSGLGFAPESQGYEDAISDPFVTGVFQGLQDTNNMFPMFPF